MELEPINKKEVALQKAGATRELAYKTYVEATKAETVHYDRYGEEVGREPNHEVRVRAADSISRLNGDLKDTGTVGIGTQVNIIVGKDEVLELMKMVNTVKEEINGLRCNGRQTGEIIEVTVD